MKSQLDLAGCANPDSWPVPPLPAGVWQSPATPGDGLAAAAANYYGNPSLCALPGLPTALSILPRLFAPAMVACCGVLGDEHPQAWLNAGHRPRLLPNASLARAVAATTPFVLLANPNPFTGTLHTPAALLDAAQQLNKRGAWLIVDESLIDPQPEFSVAAQAGSAETPKLIVLRSLADFFGLGGAPLAFIIAHSDLLARIGKLPAVPDIAHPVRAAARLALADSGWQAATCARLAAAGQRLQALLAQLGEVAGTPLATVLKAPDAAALHAHLAGHGIVVAHRPDADLLRFALPPGADDWQRLATALADWKAT